MSDITASAEELLRTLQQLECRLEHLDGALGALADLEPRLIALQGTIDVLLKVVGS